MQNGSIAGLGMMGVGFAGVGVGVGMSLRTPPEATYSTTSELALDAMRAAHGSERPESSAETLIYTRDGSVHVDQAFQDIIQADPEMDLIAQRAIDAERSDAARALPGLSSRIARPLAWAGAALLAGGLVTTFVTRPHDTGVTTVRNSHR